MLLNARSPKNPIERYFIGHFDRIISKDEKSFKDISSFHKDTFLCGNLKLSSTYIDCQDKKDTIVIGSTHEKEEQILMPVIKWILSNTDYKIVIAPRHISRSKEVLKLLEKENIKVSLKSQKEDRVIVLDTIGELKEYYKRALISIVGGSFVRGYGGHNILEPIGFCSYVVYGKYIHKIEDIASILESLELGFKASNNVLEIFKKLLEKPLDRTNLKTLESYIYTTKNCYIEHVEKFIISSNQT